MGSNSKDQKYAFKVVFLGESGVGKTCLATRFEKGTYIPNSASTIGAAFSTTTIEVSGALVKIQMWDTAGQERYHCLAPMYYREASGAFVVFDVTDMNSFEKAKTWINELKKNQPNCLVMLLGNKCELRGEESLKDKCVSKDTIKRFIEEEKLLHYEVSAKTGDNVNQSLVSLASAVLDKAQTKIKLPPNGSTTPPSGTVNLQGNGDDSTGKQNPTGQGCC